MELYPPLDDSHHDRLSNSQNDSCYPGLSPGNHNLHGVQELIANLDHDVLDVRLRALKCLLGKVECEIVSTDSLCRRIDLLNRLSDWLQAVAVDLVVSRESSNAERRQFMSSSPVSTQGIPTVIELLILLVQHDFVKRFIIEEKVDETLSTLRLQFGGETRSLIDRLLDLLDGDGKSFHFQCDGLPDVWYDNTSSQSLGAFRKDTSSTVEDQGSNCDETSKEHRSQEFEPDVNCNMSDLSAGDAYFPNNATVNSANTNWACGFKFGIPFVHLGPTDRRVFSSTIESILSKNDKLMFITTCFVRDVLLQDYPVEVFIQESSLCMAILEIAENSLNEPKLQLVAVQSLLQLSSAIRCRLVQFNCSEFFESKQTFQNSRSLFTHSTPYSNPKLSSSTTSDTFVDVLCQIMKSLSRTLLFQPQDFNIWKLMDSFAMTLYKSVTIFPVDSKNVTLGLQEVLLDIAYCYEKHSEIVNRPALGISLTSILKSIHVNDETFVLPNNVRQCLRKLLCNSDIIQCWPDVHSYILKSVSGLETSIQQTVSEVSETQNSQSENDPTVIVTKFLIAVQNATSHEAVVHAVESLWSYLFPLVINLRLNNSTLDYICNDAPWRDAFYRFLCVEPTCSEDEILLIKVVDLLNFVISNMSDGRKQLESWVVPLCLEKGCAGLRILTESSMKLGSDVILPNLLRSIFDFYFTMMKRSLIGVDIEFIWDLFSAFARIINELGDRGFDSPVILCPLLKGLAILATNNSIKSQLVQNQKFCLVLVHRVIEIIIFLQDQSAGLTNESYRNQGVLYYASLSLYHLALLLLQSKTPMLTNDWMGRTCAVIPCFWDSQDLKTRAIGFQLCELLTRQPEGVVITMSILETPQIIWTTSYNALFDGEESSLVKHKSACVLYNLISSWEVLQHKDAVCKLLHLPDWKVFDDFTKLLGHVYWLPSLSEVFRLNNSNRLEEISEDISTTYIVTPKILTVVCKILMKMKTTTIIQFHPDPFSMCLISSGICPVLFRLIGTHAVSTLLESSWWIDSCAALSHVVEALINMCQLDRNLSIMLIGDKRSLTSLVQLLTLKPHSEVPKEKVEEILSTLWVNVFTLLSVLCADSGNNFEDLERCIKTQRNIIFSRLVDWLKQETLAKCRKISLTFSQSLLSKMMFKQQEKEAAGHLNANEEYTHPLLCQEWTDKNSGYGSMLCESLMGVYEDCVNSEDKLSILRILNALVNLSPATKTFAIEHDLIGLLIDKLKTFGIKYYDSINTIPMGKKSLSQWQEEIIAIISVLSSLTYKSHDAKISAGVNGIVDICHKIFKLWKAYPDRTMLHGFIEVLLNFSEEFPAGCQALTMSTSVIGVGPRKAPNQQSFLAEMLEILHAEITGNENASNIRTIELLFELLKNAMCVLECRNILVKSQILGFLTKLHVREIKKWGPKLIRIKIMYLEFLTQITIHPDMQAALVKVPDSIEILVLLIDLENDETSLIALKILRNLSFQQSNRAKFLCDDGVLPALSSKIRDSDNLEEVESAAVGLWALINNSEKGKLLAKRSLAHISVVKAITRIRKLENSSNDLLAEKKDLVRLLNVLSNVSTILGNSSATPITNTTTT